MAGVSCEVVGPCASSPCDPTSYCTQRGNKYTCHCADGKTSLLVTDVCSVVVIVMFHAVTYYCCGFRLISYFFLESVRDLLHAKLNLSNHLQSSLLLLEQMTSC